MVCTADQLDKARISGSVVRLVGRLPSHVSREDALAVFPTAVGHMARRLPDAEEVHLIRTFVSAGLGTQPYCVTTTLWVPPEACGVLRERQDDRGWVDLPAPWGAAAALFFDRDAGGAEMLVHLLDAPHGYEPDLLQELLRQGGLPVSRLERLVDLASGLPRANAYRAWVRASPPPAPAYTLVHPNKSTLAVVKVHRISSLPPPPPLPPTSQQRQSVPEAAQPSFAQVVAQGTSRPRPPRELGPIARPPSGNPTGVNARPAGEGPPPPAPADVGGAPPAACTAAGGDSPGGGDATPRAPRPGSLPPTRSSGVAPAGGDTSAGTTPATVPTLAAPTAAEPPASARGATPLCGTQGDACHVTSLALRRSRRIQPNAEEAAPHQPIHPTLDPSPKRLCTAHTTCAADPMVVDGDPHGDAIPSLPAPAPSSPHSDATAS